MSGRDSPASLSRPASSKDVSDAPSGRNTPMTPLPVTSEIQSETASVDMIASTLPVPGSEQSSTMEPNPSMEMGDFDAAPVEGGDSDISEGDETSEKKDVDEGEEEGESVVKRKGSMIPNNWRSPKWIRDDFDYLTDQEKIVRDFADAIMQDDFRSVEMYTHVGAMDPSSPMFARALVAHKRLRMSQSFVTITTAAAPLVNPAVYLTLTQRQHYVPLTPIESRNIPEEEPALNYAIRIGASKTAKYFIESCPGVDFDARSDDGNTPLHCAMKTCNAALVEMLLNRGVNLRLLNNDGLAPIHYACLVYNKLYQGVVTSEYEVAELMMIFLQHCTTADFNHQVGVDIEDYCDEDNNNRKEETGIRILKRLSKGRDSNAQGYRGKLNSAYNTIRFLRGAFSSAPQPEISKEDSADGEAQEEGIDKEFVEEESIRQATEEKERAKREEEEREAMERNRRKQKLIDAELNESEDDLNRIASKGSAIDETDSDSGKNRITRSNSVPEFVLGQNKPIRHGDEDAFEDFENDIDGIEYVDRVQLADMMSHDQYRQLEAMRRLFQLKPRPLHLCSWLGNKDGVKSLLVAGANPLLEDGLGDVPLNYAFAGSEATKKDCIEVLLDNMPHIKKRNYYRRTVLHNCVLSTSLAYASHLLTSVMKNFRSVESVDRFGNSALLLALYAGNNAAVRELLDRDASLKRSNHEGQNIFHMLCKGTGNKKERVLILKFLLKKIHKHGNVKAMLVSPDADMFTPIGYCCLNGYDDIAVICSEVLDEVSESPLFKMTATSSRPISVQASPQGSAVGSRRASISGPLSQAVSERRPSVADTVKSEILQALSKIEDTSTRDALGKGIEGEASQLTSRNVSDFEDDESNGAIEEESGSEMGEPWIDHYFYTPNGPQRSPSIVLAAGRGHASLVEFIIDKVLGVRYEDVWDLAGNTILMAAILGRHWDIAERVLALPECAVTVVISNKKGVSPMQALAMSGAPPSMFSAVVECINNRSTKEKMESEYDIHSDVRASLLLAIHNGNSALATKIIEEFPFVVASVQLALKHAAERGLIEVVRALTSEPVEMLDTGISGAAAEGIPMHEHPPAVMSVLSRPRNIHMKMTVSSVTSLGELMVMIKKEQKIPYHLQYIEVDGVVVKAGHSPTKSISMCLYELVPSLQNHVSIICDESNPGRGVPIDVFVIIQQRGAMLSPIVAHDYEDCVTHLVNMAISEKRIDARTPDGNTLLHLASQRGYHAQVENVVRMISSGLVPKLNATNKNGDTVMLIAGQGYCDCMCPDCSNKSSPPSCCRCTECSFCQPGNINLRMPGVDRANMLTRLGARMLYDYHVEIISTLLAAKASPKLTNHQGVSPLLYAVRAGSYAAGDTLLASGSVALLYQTDAIGRTPLHAAARNGHKLWVRSFLKRSHAKEKGMKTDDKLINGRDKNSYTPLMLALAARQAVCVKYLLAGGASICVDEMVGTCFHFVVRLCSEDNEHPDSLELLRLLCKYRPNDVTVKAGPATAVWGRAPAPGAGDSFEGLTPFRLALKLRCLKCQDVLYQAGGHLDCIDVRTDRDARTSQLSGNSEAEPVDVKDIIPASLGSLKKDNVSRSMMDLSMEVEKMMSDDMSDTSSTASITRDVADEFSQYRDEDGKFNDGEMEEQANSVIFDVINDSVHDPEALDRMLEYISDVNVVNEDGDGPVLAAVKGGYVGVLEVIVKRIMKGQLHQDQVTGKDSDGRTPFQIAVAAHDSDMVRVLLDCKHLVDFNYQNAQFRTPLHDAVANGRLDMAHVILQKSLEHDLPLITDKPDIMKQTVLHTAIDKQQDEIVRLLVQCSTTDLAVTDGKGRTPLEAALVQDRRSAVAILENAKTYNKALDINKKDFEGFMPLHRAIELNLGDAVQHICAIPGVKVNERMPGTKTACIHYALRKHHRDPRAAVALIQYSHTYNTNLDVLVEDEQGVNVYHRALEFNQHETVAALLNYDVIDVNSSMTSKGDMHPLIFSIQAFKTKPLVAMALVNKSRENNLALDINVHDEHGFPAFFRAVENMQMDVMQAMMQFPGLELNIRAPRVKVTIKDNNDADDDNGIPSSLPQESNMSETSSRRIEEAPVATSREQTLTTGPEEVGGAPEVSEEINESNETRPAETPEVDNGAPKAEGEVKDDAPSAEASDAANSMTGATAPPEKEGSAGDQAAISSQVPSQTVRSTSKKKKKFRTVWRSVEGAQTALQLAVSHRDPKVAIFMLEQAIALKLSLDIDVKSSEGRPLLHSVVDARSAAILDLMLDFKCDVNCRDEESVTLLQQCILASVNQKQGNKFDRKGHQCAITLLERCLESQGNLSVNAPFRDGFTVLQMAVRYNLLEVIRLLIQFEGIHLNERRVDPETKERSCAALHLAILSAPETNVIIHTLLESPGINPNVINEKGQTCVILAAAKDDPAAMKLFVETCRKNDLEVKLDHMDEFGSALHHAIRKSNNAMISYLIERGAKCSAINNAGINVLHAVTSKRPDDQFVLQLILKKVIAEERDIDPNQKNDDGDTIIFHAIKRSHHQVLDLLLDVKGLDLNIQNNSKRTCLSMAICRADHSGLKSARLILEKAEKNQLSINLNLKDCDGYSAIFHAIKNGQSDIIKMVIESPSFEWNQTDPTNRNILVAAIMGDFKPSELARLILRTAVKMDKESIFDVNTREEDTGSSALFISVQKNLTDVTVLLLDFPNLDLDLTNKAGQSVLVAALLHPTAAVAKMSSDTILRRVVKNNMRIDVNVTDMDGNGALYLAVEKNFLDVVQLIAENPDIDMDSAQSRRALDMALTRDHRKGTNFFSVIIERLIRNQIDWDVNFKDEKGETLVLKVLQKQMLSSFRLLLEIKSIDLNQVDRRNPNRTALQVAQAEYSRPSEIEAVMMILDKALNRGYPLNLNTVDAQGKSPLHYAVLREQVEVVNMMLQFKDLDFNITDNRNRTAIREAICLVPTKTNKPAKEGAPKPMSHSIMQAVVSQENNHLSRFDPNIKDEMDMTYIAYALERSDQDLIKMLLQCKTLVIDNCNTAGETAVQMAISIDDFDPNPQKALICGTMIQCFFEMQMKFDINRTFADKRTAIHWFVIMQFHTALAWLLRFEDIHLNLKDELGNCALHYAIELGSIDAVDQILTQKRVDLGLTNGVKRSCLHLVVTNCPNSLQMMVLILRKLKLKKMRVPLDFNVKDSYGCAPLHYAVMSNDHELVEMFLGYRACDLNNVKLKPDGKGVYTALEIATMNYGTEEGQTHKTAMLCTLLKQTIKQHLKLNVNTVDENGYTALHHAVRRNQTDVTTCLLRFAAINLDITDTEFKQSPLVLGCQHETTVSSSLLKSMLAYVEKHKIKFNPNLADSEGKTALYYIIQREDPDLMRQLLVFGRQVDLNDVTPGVTALQCALVPSKRDVADDELTEAALRKDGGYPRALVECAVAVLQKAHEMNINLDINRFDKNGFASIHTAVLQELTSVVRAMVRFKDLDVNALSTEGYAALHYAVKKSNHSIVDLLMDFKGIDPTVVDTEHEWTPLHMAVLDCPTETSTFTFLYKKFLENATPSVVNIMDKEGHTVLYYAIKLMHLDIIEMILMNPFDDLELNHTARGEPLREFRTVRNTMQIQAQEQYLAARDATMECEEYNGEVIDAELHAINQLIRLGCEIGDAGRERRAELRQMKADEAARLKKIQKAAEEEAKLMEASKKKSIRGQSMLSLNSPADAQTAETDNEKSENMAELDEPEPEVIEYDASIDEEGEWVHTGYSRSHTAVEVAMHFCSEPFTETKCILMILKKTLSIGLSMDINTKDEHGMTPLHIAVERRQSDIVSILLDFASINLAATDDQNHRTAIINAIVNIVHHPGSSKIAKTILSKALAKKRVFDVNVLDSDNYSALYYAINQNNLGIVRLLLDIPGINLNSVGRDRTAVQVAMLSEQPKTQCIALILQKSLENHLMLDVNVKDKNGRSLLHHAVEVKLHDALRFLLGFSDIIVNCRDNQGFSPFHAAVRLGDVDAIELILDHKDTDPNVVDNEGMTPLHVAVTDSTNPAVVVSLLISKLTGPESKKVMDNGAKDNKGFTALYYAIVSKDLEVIELLMSISDDLNSVDNARPRPHTALEIAATTNNTDVVEIILRNARKNQLLLDVNTSDAVTGRTPLHMAVINEQLQTVSLLLNFKNIDLNHVDAEGTTALLYAIKNHGKSQECAHMILLKAREKHIDIHINDLLFDTVRGNHVGLLDSLLHFEDIDTRDENYHTLLWLACETEDGLCFDMLVNKLTQQGSITPEFPTQVRQGRLYSLYASQYGNAGALQTMLSSHSEEDARYIADSIGAGGETCLSLAIKYGHQECVKILVDYGVDLLLQDASGNTPLHTLTLCSYDRIFGDLILDYARRTDTLFQLVNVKNCEGRTALHEAARLGDHTLVTKLIEAEVEVNAVDHLGRSAMHYAAAPPHHPEDLKIVKEIIAAGGDVFIIDSYGCAPVHLAIGTIRSSLIFEMLDPCLPVKVTLFICNDCEKHHDWHTRHDSKEYEWYRDEVKARIHEDFPGVEVTTKLLVDPITGEMVPNMPLGPFEIIWEDSEGSRSTVFSKIRKKRFPSLEKIATMLINNIIWLRCNTRVKLWSRVELPSSMVFAVPYETPHLDETMELKMEQKKIESAIAHLDPIKARVARDEGRRARRSSGNMDTSDMSAAFGSRRPRTASPRRKRGVHPSAPATHIPVLRGGFGYASGRDMDTSDHWKFVTSDSINNLHTPAVHIRPKKNPYQRPATAQPRLSELVRRPRFPVNMEEYYIRKVHGDVEETIDEVLREQDDGVGEPALSADHQGEGALMPHSQLQEGEVQPISKQDTTEKDASRPESAEAHSEHDDERDEFFDHGEWQSHIRDVFHHQLAQLSPVRQMRLQGNDTARIELIDTNPPSPKGGRIPYKDHRDLVTSANTSQTEWLLLEPKHRHRWYEDSTPANFYKLPGAILPKSKKNNQTFYRKDHEQSWATSVSPNYDERVYKAGKEDSVLKPGQRKKRSSKASKSADSSLNLSSYPGGRGKVVFNSYAHVPSDLSKSKRLRERHTSIRDLVTGGTRSLLELSGLKGSRSGQHRGTTGKKYLEHYAEAVGAGEDLGKENSSKRQI